MQELGEQPKLAAVGLLLDLFGKRWSFSMEVTKPVGHQPGGAGVHVPAFRERNSKIRDADRLIPGCGI